MQKNKTCLDNRSLEFVLVLALSALVTLILTIFITDIQVNIECQKSPTAEIYCQLTRTKLLKQEKQILVPGELKRAILKTDRYEDRRLYRIFLKTKKDKIPFGMSSSEKGDKKKKVNQINDFIKHSNIALLDVKQNDARDFFCELILSGLVSIVFLFVILLQILSTIGLRLRSMIKKPSNNVPIFLVKKLQGQ